MKKIVSLIAAFALAASLLPAAMAEDAGYIAAPYNPEDIDPRVTYMTPVLYENENGPTIGVTTVGVIVKDGKYFRDADNDHELDDFENWELDAETRAADLVTKMTLMEQAGFAQNILWAEPANGTLDAVKNEDGTINPAAVLTVLAEGEHSPNLTMYFPNTPGWELLNDEDILVGKARTTIYRGGLRCDASVVALLANVSNQLIEWDCAKAGTPAIPFTMGSNPISAGFPDSLGMAAAVLADSDLENGVIDASSVRDYAVVDRTMWLAQGINFMYGPQIDLVTDPRWPRNSGTYGERENVTAAIITALVDGYQNGTEGVNENSVMLSVKHFPGDGSSENGFESHSTQGQWRLYPTEGSLQNYQLVGFQAAVDAGCAAIMPCYSRDTDDDRSVPQTYTNPTTGASMEVTPSVMATAYSRTLLTDLLRGVMGFNGFINSDSDVITSENYGAEDMTETERMAAAITAGIDVVGDGHFSPQYTVEAVEAGLLDKAELDRANTYRAIPLFKQGRFENPYLDYEAADAVRAGELEKAYDLAYTMHQKSTVLMKNSNSVLPLAKDAGTKIYVASFTFNGENEGVLAQLQELFTAQGFTVVDDVEEADVLYMNVQPKETNAVGGSPAEAVLSLTSDMDVPERFMGKPVIDGDFVAVGSSQEKTGEMVSVCTLEGMKQLKKMVGKMHDKGGIVVASVVCTSPWILEDLEPLCDALLAQYTSPSASYDGRATAGNSVAYTLSAQVDVIVGNFTPVGKLSVTMVSSEDVVALTETTLADGTFCEVCASPNDVPGYAKDQYIDPAVLANVNGGSYAYMDADGNYYVSGFGLSY